MNDNENHHLLKLETPYIFDSSDFHVGSHELDGMKSGFFLSWPSSMTYKMDNILLISENLINMNSPAFIPYVYPHKSVKNHIFIKMNNRLPISNNPHLIFPLCIYSMKQTWKITLKHLAK